MLADLLFWAVAGGVGVTALSFVVLWGANYRQTGDAERATERSTRKIVAVVSAATFSLFIAIGELAGFAGTLGDIAATWPGAIGQAVIGFIAIAGFAGWVELTAVGATFLVAGVFVATLAVRN